MLHSSRLIVAQRRLPGTNEHSVAFRARGLTMNTPSPFPPPHPNPLFPLATAKANVLLYLDFLHTADLIKSVVIYSQSRSRDTANSLATFVLHELVENTLLLLNILA